MMNNEKLQTEFSTKCLTSSTNTRIEDVTDSPRDWEDFWYNEDKDDAPL